MLLWLAKSTSEVLSQWHSLQNICRSGKKPHLKPVWTTSSSSVHFLLYLPPSRHFCTFTLTGTIFPRSLFANIQPSFAWGFWWSAGSEEHWSPGCWRALRGSGAGTSCSATAFIYHIHQELRVNLSNSGSWGARMKWKSSALACCGSKVHLVAA